MLIATSTLFLVICAPQDQDRGLVARFVLDGEPAVVTRDDLALEFLQRFGPGDRGRAAREHLIDLELVRMRADAESLQPSAKDTQAWIEKLAAQFRAQGQDLRRKLAEQGMDAEEFHAYARLQLAHMRLVQHAMGLASVEEVTPDMLQLWLKEARLKAAIVTEPSSLQPGVAARVDGRQITGLELGRALLRGAPPDEREQFVQQVIWRRSLEAEAKKHGVTVDDAEARAEVEKRRRQLEADGRTTGVSFEQMLQTQGLDPASLARSPVLRTQILEQKLSLVLHPDDALRKKIRDEPEAVLLHHGARRRIEAIVFAFAAGAVDGKLTAVDESQVAAAKVRAERIRERLDEGADFATLARTHSDDPARRVGGGNLGWRSRGDVGIPPAVRDAAFTLRKGEIGGPLRTEVAWYVIRVAAIEPDPPENVLLQRMRDALVHERQRRILLDAKIELVR